MTARQALDRTPQPHAPTIVHHRAVVGTACHLPALSHVLSRLTNHYPTQTHSLYWASASTRTRAGHSRGVEVNPDVGREAVWNPWHICVST
jgi:hypothetical protein